jgi:hypothetical protein
MLDLQGNVYTANTVTGSAVLQRAWGTAEYAVPMTLDDAVLRCCTENLMHM